jgi:hypothetical protein
MLIAVKLIFTPYALNIKNNVLLVVKIIPFIYEIKIFIKKICSFVKLLTKFTETFKEIQHFNRLWGLNINIIRVMGKYVWIRNS